MSNQIQESINQAIDTIVTRRVNALALDKTVICTIDSVINSSEGIYRVQYEGGFFEARAQYNNTETYSKDMAVYVQIPQNDTKKEKLIIGKAYNLRDSIEADVAISAINNYSIIGGNSFVINNQKLNDEGIGLSSYHDPTKENTDINALISHRAQYIYDDKQQSKYLYSLNKDNLDLYLKNASALMIEADFRTALDSQQQLNYDGSYGIGINIVFNNTRYEFGKTQGEIFDYFASDIKTTFETVDKLGNVINTTNSLANYDNTIKNIIQNNSSTSYSDLVVDEGSLDMYIAYISALVNTYSTQYQEKWLPKEAEIVDAYIFLLKALKLKSNKNDIVQEYNNWRNTSIGTDEEKVVPYVLDSNSMTGNPYAYSSWSTQYAIFDIDIKNFKRIESVLFYKNGFTVDEKICQHGEDTNQNGVIGESADGPRKDIFIRNLKIYALQPISAVNDNYRLEINARDTGLIFNSIDENKTLEIQAKVTKSYYEDLSNYVKFYWFKKDKSVNSIQHQNYHEYGGIGWTYLSQTNEKKITLVDSDNYAYENKYKCIAEIDAEIILFDTFTVYNTALMTELKLESSLGTNFSFDIGTPLIKCLVKTKNNTDYIEQNSTDFYYYWAIQTDNKIVFLDTSTADVIAEQNISNIIKNTVFYKGKTKLTSNFKTATRIEYPIENLKLASSATFICFVQQKINNKYYDIGSAELIVNNVDNPEVNEFRIVLENGNQIFQYDEYGNAPNSKKLKNPLQIKPIICHLFNPTGLEVPNSTYDVEWIVPIENSLLSFKDIPLDPNPLENNILNVNPNKQCTFNILEIYNHDYQENNILCRVKYNNKIFEKYTDFYFGKSGSNGTNGTDMVLRVLPTSSAAVLSLQPLTLYRYGYNSSTQKCSNLRFNTGQTNNNIVNGLNSGILQMQLYQKNQEVANITSSVWNIAGNTQTTTNATGKHLHLANGGAKIYWDESYQTNKYTNYIIRGKITYNDKDYYGFYALPVITYFKDTLPSYNRIAINNKTLLKEVVYNADGRNPIYNHEQGVELLNIPTNCSVSWKALGGSNDNTVGSIKILPTKETRKNNASSTYTTAIGAKHRIWILPDDEYEGGYSNNRIVATVKNNTTTIAEIIIPIHLSLNTFGLASLNAWDGNTVTIDEDGGYIMAPQIGAGEKDANNRFTGILMGKTETYTGKGSNEQETGLFGYAHGLQSIFLDSKTGNATFGLPGGYSLTEDGNRVLIPTSTKDEYNEGRIELRPGGESKIGGWKLGRRSMYYTAKQTNFPTDPKSVQYSGELGRAYRDDADAHEKDIKPDEHGILFSANAPYISIKGRQLSSGEISNDSSSQIVAGDTLEIQLDPQEPRTMGIYRHYQKTDNTWDRYLLSGINLRGQLVANKMQSLPASSNNTNLTATSIGVDLINAFEKENGYIGASFGANRNRRGLEGEDTPFFRAFIDASDSDLSRATLYITGGQIGSKLGTVDSRNDYARSLSIHGKTISLYAEDNNNDTKNNSIIQNTKLELSNTNFIAGTDTSNSYIQSNANIFKALVNRNSESLSDSSYIQLQNKGDFFGGNENLNYFNLRSSPQSSSRIEVPGDIQIRAGSTGKNYGDIILSSQKLEADSTGKVYNEKAYLKIYNSDSSWDTALKSAKGIIETADNGNISLNANGNILLSARQDGTEKAYLKIYNSGYTYLKSATGITETASNGDIILSSQKLETNSTGEDVYNEKAYLKIYNSGGTYLQSATNITETANNGNIILSSRKLETDSTGKDIYVEKTYLRMFNNSNIELKAATSILETANNGSISLSAQENGTEKAYLKIYNSGGIYLQSATNITETASNGSIFLNANGNISLSAKANNIEEACLNITNNGNSKIVSAADFTISAGSSLAFYAGANSSGISANGLYLPVASVPTNAFLKSTRPLDISSIGDMQIKANAGNNGGALKLESGRDISIKSATSLALETNAGISAVAKTGPILIDAENADVNGNTEKNAIVITSNYGGFAIQKKNDNDEHKFAHNLLISKDLGLYAPFGYFNGAISSTNSAYRNYSIISNQGIYLKNYEVNSPRYEVRSSTGEGYSFNYRLYAADTIRYYSDGVFVQGASIGALIKALTKIAQDEQTARKKADTTLGDNIGKLDDRLWELENKTIPQINDALTKKLDVSTYNNFKTNIYDVDIKNLDDNIDDVNDSLDTFMNETYKNHTHTTGRTGSGGDPAAYMITGSYEYNDPYISIDGTKYFLEGIWKNPYTDKP